MRLLSYFKSCAFLVLLVHNGWHKSIYLHSVRPLFSCGVREESKQSCRCEQSNLVRQVWREPAISGKHKYVIQEYHKLQSSPEKTAHTRKSGKPRLYSP